MQQVNLKSKKRFAAFYTLPSIWVKQPITFDESIMESNYVYSRPELLNKMSAVVHEYPSQDGKFLIQVCQDGLIMFTDQELANHKDIFEKWRYALKPLNILYMLVDGYFFSENNNFSYFQYQHLRKNDVVQPSYTREEFLGFAGPIQSYAYSPSSARVLITFNKDDGFWNDERIKDRKTVNLEILDKAAETFEKIYNGKLLNLAYIFSLAVSELKENQNELSTVHSWTVLEEIIKTRYVGSSSSIKKLLSPKKISARKQINVLRLSGDRKRYKAIQRVLDKRNKYLHHQTPISIEAAGKALNVCRDEFEHQYGIVLNYNPVVTASGL
ncbi:MAG: hypothetical protein WAW63_01380 [Candidatus Saccharimonadales bacterium]|nr:hypothetical protein [Candidatus Saccharibacteria bacterium]